MQETEFPWVTEMAGVLETINQGVIINDDCSHIVFANALFQKMIGRPENELIGQKMLDLYPPEDAAILKNRILQRQTEGHSQYEFYLPQANGNRLPVLVTARQIEDPDGNVFAVITATDITEQKRAENALREANAQLEKRHQEIEEDLLLAARVQQSLAPTGLTWGGVNVATYYQPVRTIGGDFGLVAPRQDSLSLFVCDVSGHGIGSALVANRIYTETMSQIERGVALGPMMHHLNRFVLRNIGSPLSFTSPWSPRVSIATIVPSNLPTPVILPP